MYAIFKSGVEVRVEYRLRLVWRAFCPIVAVRPARLQPEVLNVIE